MSQAEVLEKISKPSKFVWIKRRVAPDESEALKKLKIKVIDDPIPYYFIVLH